MVQVLLFVGSTQLNPDARLSFGNNREKEAYHIHSLI
jgi:hypothetical protein